MVVMFSAGEVLGGGSGGGKRQRGRTGGGDWSRSLTCLGVSLVRNGTGLRDGRCPLELPV